MRFGDILSLFDRSLVVHYTSKMAFFVGFFYNTARSYSIPATFRSMNYLSTSICSRFV